MLRVKKQDRWMNAFQLLRFPGCLFSSLLPVFLGVCFWAPMGAWPPTRQVLLTHLAGDSTKRRLILNAHRSVHPVLCKWATGQGVTQKPRGFSREALSPVRKAFCPIRFVLCAHLKGGKDQKLTSSAPQL